MARGRKKRERDSFRVRTETRKAGLNNNRDRRYRETSIFPNFTLVLPSISIDSPPLLHLVCSSSCVLVARIILPSSLSSTFEPRLTMRKEPLASTVSFFRSLFTAWRSFSHLIPLNILHFVLFFPHPLIYPHIPSYTHSHKHKCHASHTLVSVSRCPSSSKRGGSRQSENKQ